MVIRSWSLPFGSWFGVNVRLHFSYLFLLIFVWMTETGTDDPKITSLRSLAFTAIVLGSVVLHELGHLITAQKLGSLPRVVMLLPLGGLPVWEVESPADSKPTRLPPWKRR